jgi:hypothetical protein
MDGTIVKGKGNRSRSMRRRILLILIITLMASIAHAGNQGAVVLYDRVKVVFFNDGRKVWQEEQAVRVLNQKGVKDMGEVVIPYTAKHQRLKVLYAYTKLPTGRTLKPAKKAYNVVSPPFKSRAPVYSDLKYQTISMPGVCPGSVIHYAFQLRTIKPYMKGEFWTENFFQEEHPVQEATMEVWIPKGRKVKIKQPNMEDVKPSITFKTDHEGGQTSLYVVYKWVLKDVPAVEKEPSMPPMDEVAKKVVITSIPSWDRVAQWYRALASEALKPDNGVRRAVRLITKGTGSRREEIQAIYNFVAQNIRYVGMEFGINGYKPHKASEVLKNRYGDCKDHATLLIAMLRVVGVKAYPVLIPTRDIADADPSLPTPGAFNHEIAAMKTDKGLIFMDTTAEVTPFKSLPPGDQGRRVLAVKGEKGILIRTPLFPPTRNVEGYQSQVRITPQGTMMGTLNFFYRGGYADSERYTLITATPQAIKRHVERLATSIAPGFSVKSYRISPYRDLNHPQISITIKGEDRLYATPTAHLLILHPPTPGYSWLASLVASKSRTYPFVVGYKMSKAARVTLNIPKGYRLYVLPEDYHFHNDVGSLKILWRKEKEGIRFTCQLVLDRATIPAELYSQLQDLFNLTVKALKNQVLILDKSPQRKAEAIPFRSNLSKKPKASW